MAIGGQVSADNNGANTNSNAQPKPATASIKAGNTTYNIQYYPAPQGKAPTLVNPNQTYAGVIKTQYGNVSVEYKAQIVQQSSGYAIALIPYQVASNQPNLTTKVNANTLSFSGISNLSGTITEQLQPSISGGNILFNLVGASGNVSGTLSTQYGNVGLNYSVSASNNQLNLTPTGIVSNQQNLTATVNANTLSFKGISNLSGTITEQLQPTLSGNNIIFNIVSASGNITGTQSTQYGGVGLNYSVSLSNNQINLTPTGIVSNQPNLTTTINASSLSFSGISNLSGTITEQLKPSISGGNILFNLVGASGNITGTQSTPYGNVSLIYSASLSNNQINLTPTGIAPNQPNLTTTINANTLSFKGISNLSGTITEQLQPSISGSNILFNVVGASGNITGTQSTQYGNVGLNYSVSASNNQLNLTPTGIVSNQPNLTTTINASSLSFSGISNLSGTITEQLQPTLSGTNVAFNVVGISSSNLTGTMTEPLANTNGSSTVNIGVSLSASLSPNNTISLLVTGLTNPTGTHTFSDFRQRQVYAANIPFYAVTSIYPNNLIVNPTTETEYFYVSQGQLMSDVIIKQPVLVTSGVNIVGGANVFGVNIGGTPTAATANLLVRYSSRTNTYSFSSSNAYVLMNNGNYEVATFFGNQQNFTYQINKQTGKISAVKYLTVGNLPFTITPTDIAITGIAIGAGIVTGGLADVGLAAVGISGVASSVISGAASFAVMNVTSGELSSLVGTGTLQTPQAVVKEAVIGAVEGAAFSLAVTGISALYKSIVSTEPIGNPVTEGSTLINVRNIPDTTKGTIISVTEEPNTPVLSSNDVLNLKVAAYKTDASNLQASSNEISDILHTPNPTVKLFNEPAEGGEYTYGNINLKTNVIQINVNKEIGFENTLLHENLHLYLDKNPELEATKVTSNIKLSAVYTKDMIQNELATRELTQRILNSNIAEDEAIYLKGTGEYTSEPISTSAIVQTGTYGTSEYRIAYPTLRYGNAVVKTEGIGVVRTLTTDADSLNPETTLFTDEGSTSITRTTISNSRLRNFLGLKPKITIEKFTIPAKPALTTILMDTGSKTTLISQLTDYEGLPELSDVYKVNGISGSGETELATKSIVTKQGQEWLGQLGTSSDFNFIPKENVIIIERNPTQALLTPDEMRAGGAEDIPINEYTNLNAYKISENTGGNGIKYDIGNAGEKQNISVLESINGGGNEVKVIEKEVSTQAVNAGLPTFYDVMSINAKQVSEQVMSESGLISLSILGLETAKTTTATFERLKGTALINSGSQFQIQVQKTTGTQASTGISLMNGGVSIGSIGTGLTKSVGLTGVNKGTETQVQVQRTSTSTSIGDITIPSLNPQTTGLTQQVKKITGLGTTGLIELTGLTGQTQKQIYKQPTITQPTQIFKPIEVNTSISKTTVLTGGAVNITKLTSEQIEQQKTQPIQLTSLTTVQATQQKQATTTLSTSATTIPSITINPTTPTKVKVPEPLPFFNIGVLIPTAYRKAAKQKVSNKEPQFYTLSLVGIASGRAVSKEQANRLAYMGLSRFRIGAKNGKK
ncbi:MAG: hypothetical protein QXH07_05815 [Thermoplasmata archaeon]